MIRTVTLLILFSILMTNEKLLLLYPDADLSNTGKLNASDVKAIYVLLDEGLKKYSKFDVMSPSDNPICYSKECAISLADEYNANQVITSKIRVLGSKIIFTGMIQKADGSDEFTTRITAINVEDMENASFRLSKSLINRQVIEDVADIDNIIEEEEEEARRRKSLRRLGFTVGYLLPFGGERYYFYDDDQARRWSQSFINLGYIQNWELKSNDAILLDAFMNFNSHNGSVGLDLTYNKFLNKTDNSMFYGYGIGWHLGPQQTGINTYDDQWGDDEYWDVEAQFRHGPVLVGQVGYILMRTYNTNIMIRAKYHIQFTTLDTNYDNGVTFNVSLIQKFENSSSKNRKGRGRNVEYRFPLLEILLRSL